MSLAPEIEEDGCVDQSPFYSDEPFRDGEHGSEDGLLPTGSGLSVWCFY